MYFGNAYGAGREPWLPDTIWTVFGRYGQKEREEADIARRAAGETLFQVAPEDRPLLLEEHLGGGSESDSPRIAGGLMSWAASKAVGPWV